MKRIVYIKKIEDGVIYFSDGSILYSYHEQDCCETHYLDFEHITQDDFVGMLFNITENFFRKIPDYGIALVSCNNTGELRIPGYGNNNGWYSHQLELVLEIKVMFNITECQKIN